MKSLEEYIAKHGKHFTEELAVTAINCKWNPSEVERSSEALVYYNVSNATKGDIVFLANLYHKALFPFHSSRRKCVRHALDIVENVNANGYAFDLWILKDRDFDLTPYI